MEKRADDQSRRACVVLGGDRFAKVGDVGRHDFAIDRQDRLGPNHLGTEFLTQGVQGLAERMPSTFRVSVRPEERRHPFTRHASRARGGQNGEDGKALRTRPGRG